jgi:hypothetical protein
MPWSSDQCLRTTVAEALDAELRRRQEWIVEQARVLRPEDNATIERWKLHRQLSTHLTRSTLTQWRPTILANLQRLRGGVRGQPHIRNLDRWEALVKDDDVAGLHRVLTGLDRDYIEMREVTPMAGLLSDEERAKVLQEVD